MPADDTVNDTVADVLLDRLVEQGVRHIFGVPGDYNLRFLDVIEAREDVEWVGTANELNAAYAADGYARVHGFAVLVTTGGVGELSAVNGVAGSYAESVPVLQITGTPSTGVLRAGLPVHHTLLDGDPKRFQRVYEEITCAAASLDADDPVVEIDRVIGAMLAEKRPGYLALPSDLVTAPTAPDTRVPLVVERPVADEFAAAAAAALERAETVVVLADHLADRFGVAAEVNRLARHHGFQSASIAPGKGVLDEDAPGHRGLYIGALSDESVRHVVESADLIIGAGLRLIDLSSGMFTADLKTERLIDLQPDHAIVAGERFGDVPMARALAVLNEAADTRAAPLRKIEDVRGSDAADDPDPSAPLGQEVLWQRLQRFFRPDDLIAAEQGTSYYGVLSRRLPSGSHLIAQPIWASIGYTLPAMLGAQLAAAANRRAVLVIGDGSAALTIQDIGTFARHGLKPIVILANNEGYTVERAINGWNAGYNDITRWNWCAVPAALGIPDALVMRASSLTELDKALAACEQAADRFAFVEVVLDRHDVPRLLTDLGKVVAERNA